MFGKIFEDAGKFIENTANNAGEAFNEASHFVEEKKEEISENAAKNLNDIGNKISETAGNIVKDPGKVLNDAGDFVLNTTANVGNEMEKFFDGAKKWGNDTINAIQNDFKDAFDKTDIDQIVALTDSKQKMFSIWNSAKIIYYLMMVDGEVDIKEIEKFNYVLDEIDTQKTIDRNLLINECKESISDDCESEKRLVIVQDQIDRCLEDSNDDSAIPARLLLFTMLSIAYSDGEYSSNEKTLIQFFTLRSEIPLDMAVEIENSLISMLDINKELETITSLKRYYFEIAPIVENLKKRKNILLEHMNDLVYM